MLIRDKHVTSVQFNDGVIQTVTRAAAYVAAAQSVVVVVVVVIIIKFTCSVLLRDVYMQSAVLAVERWLDGWMSHTGIVSKWLKISSNFFLGLVAQPLWFLIPHYGCEILTGRGACHSGGRAVLTCLGALGPPS